MNRECMYAMNRPTCAAINDTVMRSQDPFQEFRDGPRDNSLINKSDILNAYMHIVNLPKYR